MIINVCNWRTFVKRIREAHGAESRAHGAIELGAVGEMPGV
ncbi:MAG TPA: hypothetical protein VHO84_01185 [Syntrophorhabdaceae bacterium]|nr:hypothetical protein [Syntrophorhabdaceae bacterium]